MEKAKSVEIKILLVSYFLAKKKLAWVISEILHRCYIEMGFQVETTSSQENRVLRFIDMIAVVIRSRKRYQIACVDVFNGWAFLWAEATCFLLSLMRKPYIIVLRGARLIEFSRRWPGRMRRMLNAANRVTTPSMLFRKKFSYIRSDIIRIPNLLDISLYPFRLRKKPSPKIVWLRAFDEVYNPELAIKALKLLTKDFPKISLVMIGPDKMDGSYQNTGNLVSELSLVESVSFAGPIDKEKVPNYLNQSDIFLNTTNVESFGVAVMEAAACGLPIVTTNVGELPYIWVNNSDSLLVPPDDPVLIALAIKRILVEPGLAKRLSENARKKVERFDLAYVLPQWEKLLKEVLALG